MALHDRGAVVLPGEGKTISFSATTFSGNRLRFIYAEPHSAHSLVEFVAAPGAAGTPLHFHRATDETCYVLEGTFGFQVGEQTLELTEGAFVFVPKGLEHAFWNASRRACNSWR